MQSTNHTLPNWTKYGLRLESDHLQGTVSNESENIKLICTLANARSIIVDGKFGLKDFESRLPKARGLLTTINQTNMDIIPPRMLSSNCNTIPPSMISDGVKL